MGSFQSFVFQSVTTVAALIALLTIPLGLSLSLVRDYARTYQSLRQKLREVEDLSARTIAQEQEKQHLLAVQNETLEQQVAERTAALQQSLADLRATQAQLIQREKLASLGELTAGIAHEIQNPLNFVNNFAEVSAELIQELDDEREKDTDRDPELEGELLTDLKQNITKISEHGHRAANIVRGMLEHSRVGTGQKQPTDLNALVDEYLRLSYHGLRRSGDSAKDKSVNVTLETDFAADLPTLNVVAQDLGRVLLNLFNNAFYAVGEQQKQVGEPYQPTVTVRTRRQDAVVAIHIRDNGSGIPAALMGKIFQPFFTTKPTGQGTGLGLSISYDIITNGHGGMLTVQSESGQFTEFTITLPISS
ncbi:sensor histidine kinase [Fibrisoma limi]|uniref:sensor histidine kinase n=1 Tax=Fibrisoma limi TaxID=663275 RepID=UPI001E3FA630|nr:ATP-binding protein [Fibrisoma limi]